MEFLLHNVCTSNNNNYYENGKLICFMIRFRISINQSISRVHNDKDSITCDLNLFFLPEALLKIAGVTMVTLDSIAKHQCNHYDHVYHVVHQSPIFYISM